MARLVLDADTISYVLRKDTTTVAALRRAALAEDEIFVSPVAYYEVRRGLVHMGATPRVRDLEILCGGMAWSDFLGRAVWEDAAGLWARAASRGRRQNDADVLIAAHARMIDASVVTHNRRHFDELEVTVTDWARQESS